ncbi:MAG TPA: hypothetical protein VI636_13760 [Candidatus Angelobacter sp.]
MRLRSFSWPKLLSAKERNPQPPGPALAQEDAETRASITHYLRLADQAMLGDKGQELRDEDDDDAA